MVKKTRILGIDFGLKRMGLAISDETHLIASLLPTLSTQKTCKETLTLLWKTLGAYTIERIVIGNPLHLNGKNSFLADEVKFFVSVLKEEFPGEVILWDERLSTVMAERSLKEFGLNRKKRSQMVDGVSAIILLQSYLDFLNNPH